MRGRRLFILVILVVALVTAAGLWRLQGGTASAQPVTGLKAARGDLTVTVGGVGRIVQVGEPAPIPTAPGSSTAATGETPGTAVFPRASGQVTALLVAPGDRVAAGEPLALLDDGGVAAGAISQARIDVQTAQIDRETAKLERRQKQTSDPLKGIPPTRAEFAAAEAAVTSARGRLARVLAPPRAGDVSTVRLDVKRAEADLETTLGGTPANRVDAILVAQQSVALAQGRLDRILAPPHPADVAAAEAEVMKAEADLEALVRSDRTQPVTLKEIKAAEAAIKAALLKYQRLLAPADPADVTAARLELERARVELRRLQAGPSHAALEAARQAVDTANARLSQLLSPPLASDVASARLDIRRAEAELAVLRARRRPASATDIALAQLKIGLAQGKVEAARARLSTALDAAGPLTVRAPRAGTVTALLTTLGAPVDPPAPMLAMADLDRLEVRVDLSEFDIARVKRGQRATVSVDALGGELFRGEVLFAALAGTNTSGVVTFPVQVGLTDAPRLKPGMNVSVRIVVANRRNVLQLPLEAVTQEGDEATVTVLDRSDQPASRTVKLGLANNKNVEIVKGLRAGDRVVLEEPGGGSGE
ncbi:MAG: efflux RND transporter periplasmic adaptor subunit [Gaiellaceae bacterium]